MAAITINDLPTSYALDRKAMSTIRGAGAPWVFNAFRIFDRTAPSFPIVNFYQVNNTFIADQMINQFQIVDVNNTGANSNVGVALDERSKNFK